MVAKLEVLKVVLVLVPVLVRGLPMGGSVGRDDLGQDINETALYLSSGVNQLSANLFKILSSVSDSNVVISPFSIHTAISMLFRGSQGETRSQLAAALGVDNVDHEKVLEENKMLLSNYGNMRENKSAELDVATSLFADDSFEIKEDYQRLLEEFYLTNVESVDFGDETKTVDTINGWVRNKTRNLIPSLVESVSSETKMLLLNAVYFKANWLVPFEKELTAKRSFHASPTKSVQTNFMLSDEMMEYAFLGNINADVVSLPYEDENFRMLIFLPHEGHSVEDLETQEFSSILENIDEYLFRTDLLLRLPKFKIDYSKSLVESFQQLGVSDAFLDADLSEISDEPLFVSDIVHKVAVDVTEEGSEAAAVTGVFIQARSGGIEAVMDVNRPFKFVIQDKRNNIPLFVGKINDPTNGKVDGEHDAEEKKVDEDEVDEDMVNDVNNYMDENDITDINKDALREEDNEIDLGNEDYKLVPRSGDVNNDLHFDYHFFPLNNKDTDPILNYIAKYGDGSRYDKIVELDTNNSLEDDDIFDNSLEDYDSFDLRGLDSFENNSIEEDSSEESIDIFPENNQDTEPIIYYKHTFGDGSIYGSKGELAIQARNN